MVVTCIQHCLLWFGCYYHNNKTIVALCLIFYELHKTAGRRGKGLCFSFILQQRRNLGYQDNVSCRERVIKWITCWTQDQKVWVRFPVLTMCTRVGQTSYSTLPRSTQPKWVPGAQIQGWINSYSCRLLCAHCQAWGRSSNS